MKLSSFLSVPVIAAIILFSSCSKDKTTSSGELTGSWRWITTEGGFADIHETPASTGKNIELELRSDSTYTITTNSVVTSQGAFSLTMRTCIHDQSQKRVILFSDQTLMDAMVENIENNVLSLSDDVDDGTTSQYQRN